jgi:glutathione S-transferase
VAGRFRCSCSTARPIGDSTRIIEVLERRYPDPALYPSDPDERRRALEIEEFWDEELGPVHPPPGRPPYAA